MKIQDRDWHKSAKGCWSLTARVAWLPGPGHAARAGRNVSMGSRGSQGGATTGKVVRDHRTAREALKHAEAFLQSLFETMRRQPRTPSRSGKLWTKYQQESPGYKQNTERHTG